MRDLADAQHGCAGGAARWLTPALLGCLLGTAFQLQQPELWPANGYLLAAALVLMPLALWRPVIDKSLPAFARVVLWLLVAALLAFAGTGLRALVFANTALDPALEGRDIAVSGVVSGLPQPFEGGLRFHFELDRAELGGQLVNLPARLELAWYAGLFGHGDAAGESAGEWQSLPAPLQAGERWSLTVRLKAPHGAVNPHGFDQELRQWEQGVQAVGYVRAGPKDPRPRLLAQTGRHPLDRARQRLRERIFATVAEPGAAGLIAALVVGDQGAIERTDWDVYRATGVAHLMSISGLHITMFSWLAAAALGALWRRSQQLCAWLPAPSAALLGGLLLAGAYALFSGWGVPAQRTVLMLATVSGLRLLGLRWPWPMVWLLACVVVLLVDPWALLQAGFWLSFVAVGVLFASGPADLAADSQQLRGRAAALLREQWLITLALTPLSLLLFGQVSLVGLLANLLAIPWVTLLLTPLAMLGAALPPLWDAAAWAAAVMADVLRWLASWPWAVFSVAQAPAWAGVLGVLGGSLLALRLPWSLRLAGLPLLLPVLLWQPPRPANGQFELLAADIGQGSAVLVRTAAHALLYDAGPRFSSESDAGQRVLVPLLRALNVSLDTLVLSHRDSDHAGGAQSVLRMQPGARLLSSFEPGPNWPTPQSFTRCEVGQRWRWDGVDFEILHPPPAYYASLHKTNAMSCVLRIGNGVDTALLVGDIEIPQEALLLQTGGDFGPGQAAALRADVLLVPHHGSKSSSSAVFLDAVQPRIALVQAGYRNRFGHPAGPVLVRYVERGAKPVDTPHCGAATWRSWQPDDVVCQRELDRRYWRHVVP